MSNLNKILIVLLLILIAALGAVNILKANNPFTKKNTQNKDLSIILVTFGERDEKGIWQGEIAPYMEVLKEEKEISAQTPQCARSFEGKIYNQNVIVAVTGTGKLNAYSCATALIERTGERVKEVVISGIAGFSPTKATEPVMIGDVCVAFTAIDYDLQYYGADKANSDFYEPVFWHRDASSGSSKVVGERSLADTIINANKEIDLIEKDYELDTVTNTQYHQLSRAPRVWGPTECFEASGDLFWHDSGADKKARELGSSVLSEETRTQINPENIIAATAMEGVAVGKAVNDWNTQNNDKVQYVIVRSGSNFDQPPRGTNTLASFSSKESLENNLREENIILAVKTHAQPYLNLLKARGTEQTTNKNQIKY